MLIAVIFLYSIGKEKDRVERYIEAVAIWMLYCFLSTEIMSVFRVIGSASLRICWLGFDIILVSCFLLLSWKHEKRFWMWGKGSVLKKFSLGIFMLVMLGLALKTMPYNWDSMTYHMPRVFHWLQNGSVAHYATNIGRQVASPVLGAYVNLHVYALAGGNDLFVNLLQSVSYLSSGILVYAIAGKIGCSTKYCLIAGMLFYSMPIAFAESFTTQVDNFACFWMLCFVYLLLGFLNMGEKIEISYRTTWRSVILSLSVAFGYLTKPSIGFGMLIMLLWLLITVIRRRDKMFPLAIYFVLAGVVIACIVIPEFLRNLETYHALASAGTGQRQLIGSGHWRYVTVNFVKNFTYNMPTVWIFDSTNLIWKYVLRFSRFLGVDIDDPVISEDGREFQVRDPQNYGNSTAVNPVLTWLLVGCIILFVFYNCRKKWKDIKNQYFVMACISFLCFCAVLRWEPFVSRYMISYFAVLCPALAGQMELFFDNSAIRKSKIERSVVPIICFLCCTEMLGMFYYHGKIAFEQSKSNGYFVTRRELTESYGKLADMLEQRGYSNIGLVTGGDSYEYPIIAMIENYGRIEHVNVENETGKYEDLGFIPDIIIALNYDGPDYIVCHGQEYKQIEWLGEEVSVLTNR